MSEGSLALRAGDSGLALDLLLKAEKEDPENPHIHYNLGIAYLGKDLLDKSEQQFKEAIRLKPDFSEAYNYLGRIYLYRGQTEAAIQCFQKALNNVLYNNPERLTTPGRSLHDQERICQGCRPAGTSGQAGS